MKVETIKRLWAEGCDWGRQVLKRKAVDWYGPVWGTIPTGQEALDRLLPGGGFPRGQLVEVGGSCSSTMASIGAGAARHMVEEGGCVVLMDLDGGVVGRIRSLLGGLGSDRVFLIQPESGEMALTICRTLIQSGGVDLILGDCLRERHFIGALAIAGGMRSRLAVCRKALEQGMDMLGHTAAMSGTCLIVMNPAATDSSASTGANLYAHKRHGNLIRFHAVLRLLVEGHGRAAVVRLIKNNVDGIGLSHPAIYSACRVNLVSESQLVT